MESIISKIPPDTGEKQKHKSVKIKLSSIMKNKHFSDIINKNVFTINKIVRYGYQFFRMLMLDGYNNIDTDVICRQFFYNVLKSVCEADKIKYNKDDTYACIFKYHNDNYNKFKFDKIDSKNMSFILQYASIEMSTCFENNLMNHFKDYLNKYINALFLHKQKKEIQEKYKKDDEKRKELLRELTTDIKNLKCDLYTNSVLVKYNGKHVDWLNENRNKLVPVFEKDNINYQLKKNPLSILKYAIYINQKLEELKIKNYQIFPQRNDSVYKHIMIDHAGLVDMLGDDLIKLMKCDKSKSYVMLHPKEYQNRVFETFFNMKHKVFKQKGFVYNCQFKTDGVSMVLDFVNHRVDKYEKKKKDKKEEIKDEKKEETKVDNKVEHKTQKKEESKVDNKVEQKIKKKEELKVDDKTKNKAEQKKENKSKKKENNNETKKVTQKELFKKPKDDENFPDLEKLTNKQIKEINDEHIVVGVDPGKKSLLTMIDNKGVVFQYNAVQYRHETYHKFAHKIKEKERNDKGIAKIENELKDYNNKSMNPDKFMEFVHKKNEVCNKVFDFYNKPLFRNINFRIYCREKQAEAELINNVKNTFSPNSKRPTKRERKGGNKREQINKPITLMYGNWSRDTNNHMKNFFPTPNKWLRNLLATKFNIVIVDEFKTSCICSKTEKEIEKHKYMMDGKMKECHKVLTISIKNTNPTGEAISRIFIDRDINGAKNILKIGKSWLKNKTRPEVFCRKLVKSP